MAPRVAVLHHPRSYFPLELVSQVGDAADLLWVLDEAAAADTELVRLLRQLGVVATLPAGDLDAAARALARYRPEGIVTFVDEYLLLGAELAERLSVPFHTPEVARLIVDKRRQRSALAAAGVPGPAFWSFESGTDASAHGTPAHYPVVAKPAIGGASRGVELVGCPEELAAYRARNAEVGLLVEEYLGDDPDRPDGFDGTFSVESVVCNARASHVALSGRFSPAPPFRDAGCFVPAALSPEDTESALELADRAIGALGIETAVVSTKLKATPAGLAVIEVNGRLGGRAPFVVNGVSTVNLFAAACQLAVGKRIVFGGVAACDGVGFWLMCQPPTDATRVRAIKGVDVVSRLRGIESIAVLRTPGQAVDWRLGSECCVAAIRGRVPDHAALLRTTETIRRRLSVTYGEPDEHAPALEASDVLSRSRISALGEAGFGGIRVIGA